MQICVQTSKLLNLSNVSLAIEFDIESTDSAFSRILIIVIYAITELFVPINGDAIDDYGL